jgi:hypothetical protein
MYTIALPSEPVDEPAQRHQGMEVSAPIQTSGRDLLQVVLPGTDDGDVRLRHRLRVPNVFP